VDTTTLSSTCTPAYFWASQDLHSPNAPLATYMAPCATCFTPSSRLHLSTCLRFLRSSPLLRFHRSYAAALPPALCLLALPQVLSLCFIRVLLLAHVWVCIAYASHEFSSFLCLINKAAPFCLQHIAHLVDHVTSTQVEP